MIDPWCSVLSVFYFDRWTSPKADGHHYSLIYFFRAVVVSLACGRATNQKKGNTDITEKHGSVFSRILFFDFIELVILGFWFGFIWI